MDLASAVEILLSLKFLQMCNYLGMIFLYVGTCCVSNFVLQSELHLKHLKTSPRCYCEHVT